MVKALLTEGKNYMNTEIAQFLVKELERQFKAMPALTKESQANLVQIIQSTPIRESPQFDEEPAEETKYTYQDLSKDDHTAYLYVTRILRNWNAGGIRLGDYELIRARIGDTFGGMNSGLVLGHLRKNKELVNLLIKKGKSDSSLDKLSLLLKYEESIPTYNERGKNNKDPKLIQEIHRETPILIIPNINDDELKIINDFEKKETRGHLYINKGIHGIIQKLRKLHYLSRHLRYQRDQYKKE